VSDKRRWIRTKPRGLVSQTGKIMRDSKAVPIECTVIDLSVGGACLELSRPQDVPQRFEFLHGSVRKVCNVAWRRGYRIGITFLGNAEKSVASVGLTRSSRERS